MSTLLNLQRQLQDYILNANQAVAQHVVSISKVSSETRLNIYGTGYRIRLHEALIGAFPVLSKVMGDDTFEALSYNFMDAYPPQDRTFSGFTNKLAEFLRQHKTYQKKPYLAELADFETNLALVFNAEDSPLLQIDDMQKISPESWGDMRFKFHPSVRLGEFFWNVAPLWLAYTNQKSNKKPRKNPAKVTCIFWREQFISQFSALPEEEAWAIQALKNNASFGEIAQGLCQWVAEEEAGLRAASLLKGWISAGLFTSVVVMPKL